MTIQIEEGKRYLSRAGHCYGPMKRIDKSPSPIAECIWVQAGLEDQAHYCWRGDGTWHITKHEAPMDLILEVSDDSTRIDRVIEAAATLTAEKYDIKAVIADEAKRIVSGARRGAYGRPEDNFARIARYWDAYFKNTGRNIDITPADVSPLMRLVKEARLNETPDHYDSHVDLAGYTLTGAEVNGVTKPA